MAQKFPKYGDHTLDYFFTEEINENVASSRRFRVAVHRMGVRLQNLDKAPSTPDNLLETVIEFLINETRNQRTINGKRPDRFSVIFRSAVLQTPIQVSKSIFFCIAQFSDWLWKLCTKHHRCLLICYRYFFQRIFS